MSDPHEQQPGGRASRVGTWIRGKYFLERELGSGGMAIVYAARHRNKKRFAVKILHPELARNAEVQTRFLREGYVANSVEHPGAVTVLDEDITEDGAAFLVMELLEGETVEHVAKGRGGQLGLAPVLAIAHQVLEVLGAAHAKNVVHRDIKPGNLFLTHDGEVKVLDFGIARLHESSSPRATQNGSALGTPAFMAPEQALGKTGLVDGRSDVWSVGATMFALLTGRDVHEGETPQHMMVLAATARAPSVSTLSRFMPASAAALIDRALAFDQAERWPSAQGMDDALCALYAALFGEEISRAPLVDLAARRAFPSIHEVAATVVSPGGTPPGAGDTTVAASPVHVDSRSGAGQAPEVLHTSDVPPVGRTTEQPVSDGKGEPSWEPPRSRWIVVVGVAAAVLGVGLVVGFRHFAPLPAASGTAPVAVTPGPGTAAAVAPPAVSTVSAAALSLAVDPPEPAASGADTRARDAAAPATTRTPPRSGLKPPGADTARPHGPRPAAPPGETNGATNDFDRQ